jgi:glyoxylase-like metal-dependent hydrolase (beta-lactamase superfamily II)
LSGVFLSHWHWDHTGDVHAVDKAIPIYLGNGTMAGIQASAMGFHIADPVLPEGPNFQELPLGQTEFKGFKNCYDFFGDGSFLVVDAPGVSC